MAGEKFDPKKDLRPFAPMDAEDVPPHYVEEDEQAQDNWGVLDDANMPELPPEYVGHDAPPPSDRELSDHLDRIVEVEDEQQQDPAQPAPETPEAPAVIRGYIQNPKPEMPTPFVEYLFNMKTINEINAGPGVGKTTLLSMLAACVATGRPFLDAFRVKKGISVFFTEDAETVINCLSAWQLEWGVNILDHVLIYDKPAALTDIQKEVMRDGQIIKLPRPKWGETASRQISEIREFAGDRRICMVVYDSKSFHLSSAMRNGKALDENSNDDQQYVTFCGQRFSTALGACGIFVPHVSKEAERSASLVLESRGGGAAKGAVWKTFSLTLDKTDSDKVIMAAGKRRGGGIAQLLRLTRRSMPIFEGEFERAQREKYEREFADAIPPENPLAGLRPIDPAYCGGYFNQCEIVTEDQLAEELKAHLEGEKKKERAEGKQKPTNAEQKVLDILIHYCGGKALQSELSKICEEKLRAHRSNILRSIRTLIEKQYIRAFDELNGGTTLTAKQASMPPLAEQ